MRSIVRNGAVIAAWLMLISGAWAEKALKCAEYPPAEFRLFYEINNPTIGSQLATRRRELDSTGYRLILVYQTPEGILPHPQLHLLRRKDRKDLGYAWLECIPSPEIEGTMECHAECDGGTALLDRSKNILFLGDALGFEGKVGDWEVRSDREGKLNAVPVACPSWIQASFSPFEEAYIQEVLKYSKTPVHYVCYGNKVTEKGKVRFVGCQTSRESCTESRLQKFGHYPTEAETYRAFLRCRSSSPKPTQ